MSSDVNHYVCTGRLARDAESRAAGNAQVFGFSIAVNHYDKKEQKDVADFFNVELWASSEKQAEYYKGVLKKGTSVVVEGFLKLDRWEKDGQKHSAIKIVANGVQPMGKAKGGESSDLFPSEFPEG